MERMGFGLNFQLVMTMCMMAENGLGPGYGHKDGNGDGRIELGT